MRFRNRTEAGVLLAKALEEYRHHEVVVYALPRGGVALGAKVAKQLGAPLDLIITRKIGHPANAEYAVGAITDAGHFVCDKDAVRNLDPEWLETVMRREQVEAERRRQAYLAGRPQVDVKAKTAIIVDDGVATGLTMLAAILELKERQPAKVIVAVPVMARDAISQLEDYVDEVVTLDTPEVFRGAVGAYYDEFGQVEDEEVIHLLDS